MIRPYREGDLNFTVNSWLRSFESSNRAGKWATKEAYRDHYQPLVVAQIALCPPLVMVADDNPDAILGYVCGNEDRLHYLYVKQLYRYNPEAPEMRVADELMDAAKLVDQLRTTYWTPAWHEFAKRRGIGYKYDPNAMSRS